MSLFNCWCSAVEKEPQDVYIRGHLGRTDCGEKWRQMDVVICGGFVSVCVWGVFGDADSMCIIV